MALWDTMPIPIETGDIQCKVNTDSPIFKLRPTTDELREETKTILNDSYLQHDRELTLKEFQGVAVKTSTNESAPHIPEGEVPIDQVESQDGSKQDFVYNMQVGEVGKLKKIITGHSVESSKRTINNPNRRTVKSLCKSVKGDWRQA